MQNSANLINMAVDSIEPTPSEERLVVENRVNSSEVKNNESPEEVKHLKQDDVKTTTTSSNNDSKTEASPGSSKAVDTGSKDPHPDQVLATPGSGKKKTKKDWEALRVRTPTLRPRKAEPSASESPAEKKIKKTPNKTTKQATDLPKPPALEKMLPPELPLAESCTPVPLESLSGEMPLLLSETSSTSSEASHSQSSHSNRRRKNMKFSRKKKRAHHCDHSKERAVPSPSIAEGNVNPACPESSATVEEAANPALCLCGKKPQVLVSSNNNTGDLTCQALDSLDGRVIGCCNPLPSTTVGLHRPSSRTPYIMLCAVHLQRLIRHNCCPVCGLFCTQGKFLACKELHTFHILCERQEGCPHCGDPALPKGIVISLKTRKNPVFLPNPRSARTSKPAKMSVTKCEHAEADASLPITLPPEVEKWRAATDPPSPDSDKYTHKSLLNAVRSGDAVKMLKIMSAGLNPSYTFPELKHQTTLHIAASLGHNTLVHLLLQAGLPVDLLDGDQQSALSLAVLAGHSNVIKYLVKAGASLILKGNDGMTPLHLAAKSGNLEACNILLSAPSVPRRYVDSLDDGGWTPLVWASEFNHINVVRYLLNEGGDPLIRDTEHNIALHWASYGGCLDVVELLLSNGCDVAAVNAHGDSPLHIAARQGKYDCVLLLLARGAYSDVKNTLGETPRDCSILDSPIYKSLTLNDELNQLVSKFRNRGPKVLSNDISRGRERNPIQCVNGVDDVQEPRDFVYVSEGCFTSRIVIDRTISNSSTCSCQDRCTSGSCTCTSISLRAWYDYDGRLSPEFSYIDPPMIFECNQYCGCNLILCQNRVVQRGIYCRIQLFRTQSRGWGIKTLQLIPKGTYVCEYVGEIITDSEADHREDSYLFDLDNRDGETFCIDARKYGNMARFINHMCSPNLIPIKVFTEHQDMRFPRIAFFANQDILPNTELGYDYGEKFWVIKWQSFTCICGSDKCKYSDATIDQTLELYRRKLEDFEDEMGSR